MSVMRVAHNPPDEKIRIFTERNRWFLNSP